MKVEKTIEIDHGHKIEFGMATWDEKSISIRNSYSNSNDGFSPNSSGEIPIEDVKLIFTESVKNGYITDDQLFEIMDICVKKLRSKKNVDHVNIKLMSQAYSDLLFLADIKEIDDDFSAIDFETI